MSSTVIHREFRADGVLVDPTSVLLRDATPPADSYGVRRQDTGAVVVASGTVIPRLSTGIYELTFADPAPGLTYEYVVEVVYLGETYRFDRILAGGTDDSSASFLTLARADALAAARPGLAKYKAGDGAVRTAALLGASEDVNAAGPYQGRRYRLDGTQTLEFPRVAYESSGAAASFYGGLGGVSSVGGGQVIWDWDAENGVAVTPTNVELACLYQADAIIDGALYKALEDQARGVASKSVGSLSVSYRDPAAVLAVMGARDGLCRKAAQFLAKYRLKQGRLL